MSGRSLATSSRAHQPRVRLQWVLLIAPLLYLWFRLINNLRVEWETNPQYSYGYIVPFLCLGLLLHRWRALRPQPSTLNSQPLSSLWLVLLFLFAALSFLYLPVRLIELATPEWRPIQWALGFIAIGLTLVAIYLTSGATRLRLFAFPICFFLVAIPWPTPIEQPIIQFLTRVNAALVIEVMGFLGVPALQHGNVIEVGTGVVGIDEACSGIRSFQSSIMISLFLGALYDLSRWRRVLFVPLGFALAMLFNLGRTSFLTWVAAKEGVEAIEKYHDPAGLWILVGCTLGLWGIGLLMKRRKNTGRTQNTSSDVPAIQTSTFNPQLSTFNPQHFSRNLALGLILWLALVEIGTQSWYRVREAQLVTGPDWTMAFPQENPTFKELPMAPKTYELLKFDDGKQGAWTETDGTTWQAFYFNWRPGRVAGYLAKRHTPEVCMPATGREMESGPELVTLQLHGLHLPMRRYRFGPAGNSLHVYHCRWEAGATTDSFVEQESTRFNLIRGIWAGRGNKGQKIIEIIISGTEDATVAQELMAQRLSEMIKLGQSESRKTESRLVN